MTAGDRYPDLLDDLDLDDNEIMDATGRFMTKGCLLTRSNSFQSAVSLNNTDVVVRARINLDGNDLYNVDDIELDQMQGGMVIFIAFAAR